MKKDLKEAISGIEVTQFDGQKADLEELVNPKQLEKIISDWMPEVLSKEWIDEHEKRERLTGPFGNVYLQHVVPSRYLQNLLVPKQELPVIPKFVAEFLIGKEDYMLYELFDDEWLYKEHDRVAKWLYDNDELTNKQREIDLVMARDRGYLVEEEQRYYVLGKHDTPILFRDHRSRITETSNLSDIYPKANSEDFEFTEQEIKDYDERYWAFAVKVEELEE